VHNTYPRSAAGDFTYQHHLFPYNSKYIIEEDWIGGDGGEDQWPDTTVGLGRPNCNSQVNKYYTRQVSVMCILSDTIFAREFHGALPLVGLHPQ
jgi:hypothetical protein